MTFSSFFDRDVQCIRTFFKRRFNFESDLAPSLSEDVIRKADLDVALSASGSFTKQMLAELEAYLEEDFSEPSTQLSSEAECSQRYSEPEDSSGFNSDECLSD
jgi:RIO kinase 2